MPEQAPAPGSAAAALISCPFLYLPQSRVEAQHTHQSTANFAGLEKKHLRAEEQDREDIAEARRAWTVMQQALDPSCLVFLDEIWATTNISPTRGYARKGECLICAMPHGHWHTTTFLFGLCSPGLVVPLVLDGAIKGATFLAYVEQFLAPTLSPGDVVVLDNLSSHKVSGVREVIEACGAALLYLPPYSPDQNPVELAFRSSSACSETQPNAPSRRCGRP